MNKKNQRLFQLSLVVADYDEAINFYVNILGFELVEDIKMSETKRWVVVKPAGKGSCSLLLAKAANDAQKAVIGNQTGGRVFLFMHTDNFDSDVENLRKNKVEIVRGPVEEAYGKVAVFKDLYGNLLDLIEPLV